MFHKQFFGRFHTDNNSSLQLHHACSLSPCTAEHSWWIYVSRHSEWMQRNGMDSSLFYLLLNFLVLSLCRMVHTLFHAITFCFILYRCSTGSICLCGVQSEITKGTVTTRNLSLLSSGIDLFTSFLLSLF